MGAIVVDVVEVVVVDVVVGAAVVVEVVVGASVVVEVVVDGAAVVEVVIITVDDVILDSVELVFTSGGLWGSLTAVEEALMIGEFVAVSFRDDGATSAFTSVELVVVVILLERGVVDGAVIVVFPITVVEVMVVVSRTGASSFSGLLSNLSEGPMAAPSILDGLGLGGLSYNKIVTIL